VLGSGSRIPQQAGVAVGKNAIAKSAVDNMMSVKNEKHVGCIRSLRPNLGNEDRPQGEISSSGRRVHEVLDIPKFSNSNI
jgi:hypothetical protein